MTTTTAHQLEITVPPDEPVITSRRFVKAPPALVWQAWTDPAALRQWLGPRALEMVVCEIDLRVGGSYRFVQRSPDGQEFAFHGEYRELEPPHRMVNTFIFDGMPDAYSVETLVLEEVEGGTMMIGTSVHSSLESRNTHLANGMEYGMRESSERLDEWVAAQVGA